MGPRSTRSRVDQGAAQHRTTLALMPCRWGEAPTYCQKSHQPPVPQEAPPRAFSVTTKVQSQLLWAARLTEPPAPASWNAPTSSAQPSPDRPAWLRTQTPVTHWGTCTPWAKTGRCTAIPPHNGCCSTVFRLRRLVATGDHPKGQHLGLWPTLQASPAPERSTSLCPIVLSPSIQPLQESPLIDRDPENPPKAAPGCAARRHPPSCMKIPPPLGRTLSQQCGSVWRSLGRTPTGPQPPHTGLWVGSPAP
mmetsp:Transcript_100432/g.230586  ORF Transcript_100432/g.230586 Transcript_100432/m.230586 type:complete len:249 (-) Transcript_100432:116-862(-)